MYGEINPNSPVISGLPPWMSITNFIEIFIMFNQKQRFIMKGRSQKGMTDLSTSATDDPKL